MMTPRVLSRRLPPKGRKSRNALALGGENTLEAGSSLAPDGTPRGSRTGSLRVCQTSAHA